MLHNHWHIWVKQVFFKFMTSISALDSHNQRDKVKIFFQSPGRRSCEFEMRRAFAYLADKVWSHVRRVAELSKHLQVADTADGIPQVGQAVGAHHHHGHVGPDAVKLSAEREEEVGSNNLYYKKDPWNQIQSHYIDWSIDRLIDASRPIVLHQLVLLRRVCCDGVASLEDGL